MKIQLIVYYTYFCCISIVLAVFTVESSPIDAEQHREKNMEDIIVLSDKVVEHYINTGKRITIKGIVLADENEFRIYAPMNEYCSLSLGNIVKINSVYEKTISSNKTLWIIINGIIEQPTIGYYNENGHLDINKIEQIDLKEDAWGNLIDVKVIKYFTTEKYMFPKTRIQEK